MCMYMYIALMEIIHNQYNKIFDSKTKCKNNVAKHLKQLKIIKNYLCYMLSKTQNNKMKRKEKKYIVFINNGTLQKNVLFIIFNTQQKKCFGTINKKTPFSAKTFTFLFCLTNY